jgi:outer membrane protein assembly factor BamB
MIRSVLFVVMAGLSLSVAVAGEDTCRRTDGWRGPFNNGVYPAHDLPRQFDMKTNLRWVTPMPSITVGEPIVVGRLAVTLSDPDEVIACDMDTGAIVWRTRVDVIALVGKLKGYSEQEIARDRQIYQRAYAAGYLRAYGDWYPWQGGESQIKDAVKLARHLYGVLPGKKPDEIPDPDVFWEKHGNKADPKKQKEAGGIIESYINLAWQHLEGRYGKRFGTTWMTLVTRAPATPVTDGERIWVTLDQGQVACLDATGRILWFHDGVAKQRYMGSRARYVPSPLLAEGKLALASGYHVMALDALTGQVAWDHDLDTVGQGYQCGSPVYLRAGAAAGEPLYGAEKPTGVGIIVTAGGKVFRLSDGKILIEELPDRVAMCGSESGGGSPVPLAADTVSFLGGGNGGGPRATLRFLRDGADGVRVEKVWQVENSTAANATSPYIPSLDAVLQPTRDGFIALSASNGQVVAKYDGKYLSGWPSPAVADGMVILASKDDWAPQDQPKVTKCKIGIIDLKAGKVVYQAGLVDGIPGQCTGFLSAGEPVFGKNERGTDIGNTQAGAHPYGNAILLRTKGALICWGRPGKYVPPGIAP